MKIWWLTFWHDITALTPFRVLGGGESDVFLMLAKLSYGKSGKQEQGKGFC